MLAFNKSRWFRSGREERTQLLRCGRDPSSAGTSRGGVILRCRLTCMTSFRDKQIISMGQSKLAKHRKTEQALLQ